jgi:membrane protease YdiL (CAAX protease family)
MNHRKTLLVTAWGCMLLVSTLPDVILQEAVKVALPWLFWGKVVFLAAALAAAAAWKRLRPLWTFLTALLVLYLAEWFFQDFVAGLPGWQKSYQRGFFTVDMFGSQMLRLGAALAVVILMLALKRRWSAFFLVKGDLNASAAPIPLLMSRPVGWRRLGWILAACISLGTLAFLLLASQTPPETVMLALPLLPAVIVLAAMNAFSEEMSYRAGLLATLQDAIDPGQALLVTAAFFGLGHYYGVPYGILGVLMAGVLGWLLGKSMLETKGFFWAWFIHFLQDVLIFSFTAIGSVVPGGS